MKEQIITTPRKMKETLMIDDEEATCPVYCFEHLKKLLQIWLGVVEDKG